MQRTHVRRTPLTPAELEKEREKERLRQKWDPGYISARQAAEIPREAIEADPTLRARIQYSQPDWPEGKMSARTALADAPPGAGETIEDRSVDAATLFQGKRES